MSSKKFFYGTFHSMYASAPTPLYVGGYEKPVMARR
jgi:hypothetical protein